MTTYFGFAIADSMLPDDADISKRKLSVGEAKELIESAIPCLNPSHTATIEAMTERFGIQIEIPEKPPIVNLEHGDVLIVMGVRGLPRLTDRHHYTTEEIAGATFKFSEYKVFKTEHYEDLDGNYVGKGVDWDYQGNRIIRSLSGDRINESELPYQIVVR